MSAEATLSYKNHHVSAEATLSYKNHHISVEATLSYKNHKSITNVVKLYWKHLSTNGNSHRIKNVPWACSENIDNCCLTYTSHCIKRSL